MPVPLTAKGRKLKQSWLDALRGGAFTEGRRVLRRAELPCPGGGAAYDALGVLCEVSGLGEWVDMEDGTYSYSAGGEGGSGMAPRTVTDRLGMTKALRNKVAWMSDRGDGFAEIADYLEAVL